MLPHLREEEDVALPLCRAYFTPQEVAAKLREIMKRASPIELGSFWHTCGSKAASASGTATSARAVCAMRVALPSLTTVNAAAASKLPDPNRAGCPRASPCH